MKMLITVLIVIFLSQTAGLCQEVKAIVNVNTEQLQQNTLPYVSNMANDLMNYINNQKFLDNDWEGDPIPVEINIVLSGGTGNIFNARLFMISKRNLDGPIGEAGQTVTLKIKEDQWRFEYSMGANFSYNSLRYDYFSSMIDFYILLIIGFDLDTWGELDGNPAFVKAKSIAQLAASSQIDGFRTTSQPGEFTKFNLITELTDMRYYDLRKLFFAYYVDGLDKMFNNKEEGLKTIQGIIATMADFKQNKMVGPSVLLQSFFDTKAPEIAAMFNGYNNPALYKDLKYLDPGSTLMYEDSQSGKLR